MNRKTQQQEQQRKLSKQLKNQLQKPQNKTTGSYGETIASSYLQDKGYSILYRNYLLHWGEIDIIAEKENTLVFVEVKTRIGYLKGKPYENVHSAKLKHLFRSAQYFLKQHDYSSYKYRIDVISIVLSTTRTVLELKHFENVLG